jgi:hypothetical protein
MDYQWITWNSILRVQGYSINKSRTLLLTRVPRGSSSVNPRLASPRFPTARMENQHTCRH